MIHLTSVIHDTKTNSVEATWVDAEGVQVRCHSYADLQMSDFEADLGSSLTEYTDLVATVRAGIVPYVAPPIPVPTSVSPRQIRQALTRVNLRDAVEAAVAQGDQDLKDWWEFSTVFERSNTQVQAMGTALGITDLQLDDLWILASSL